MEMLIENHAINEGLGDILKKSSQLMANKGFYGTSMRDLAKATGRSLSGLYHYFRSKEDLLYLINYCGFSQLLKTLDGQKKVIEKPEENLYGAIYLHVYFFIHHMDEMRIMCLGTHSLAYERAKTIRELKSQYTALVSGIINAAYDSQTHAPLPEDELARKTFLLFGMMNWIFSWYSEEKYGSADQLADDCYLTFTQGVFGGRAALAGLPGRDQIAAKIRSAITPDESGGEDCSPEQNLKPAN
mgnify:CR=1 FL=1